MRSFVTSKNVKWCHLIWPTLYGILLALRDKCADSRAKPIITIKCILILTKSKCGHTFSRH